MALPTDEILLRSPYWVTKTDSTLDYILVDLRVWTGDLSSDRPDNATIKLRSTALNGTASIDIAELARDFVEVAFTSQEESSSVFIEYQVTSVYSDGSSTIHTAEELIGLDGYGTFTDGANFSISDKVLISADKIHSYTDTNNRIPVLATTFTGYKLQRLSYVGYSDFHTASVSAPSDDTEDVIAYVNTSNGGVYADRVVFEFSDGPDVIKYIEYQDCNKHGVTVCYFVNRFGAVQQIHFSGRFNVSLSAEDTKYTRNILENGSYSEFKHQERILQKNGKISMELNTGWVPEEDNDTFIELMMSEQVWVNVDADKLGVGWVPKQSNTYTIPVNLESKNLDVKNRLNDKVINYSFKFKASNDWINSVR